MSTNENRPKFFEIAVFFILHLSNAPSVLATLASSSIRCDNVLLRTNDREWHGPNQASGVLQVALVVIFKRRCVNSDPLCLDNLSYLIPSVKSGMDCAYQHTLCLNLARSPGLSVSALAITGIRLTRVHSRFIISMSSGFRVWPVGLMKYRQA